MVLSAPRPDLLASQATHGSSGSVQTPFAKVELSFPRLGGGLNISVAVSSVVNGHSRSGLLPCALDVDTICHTGRIIGQ